MKAIIYTSYGPPNVLQLREIADPEPKEDQVLVSVHAASVNALDYRRFEDISVLGRLMEKVFLKTVNMVPGADIAGSVDAVGAKVKQFRPGDEVFGLSAGSIGGFAEYVCAAEHDLVLKPANVTFEEAAAIPIAALTALQGLRDKGGIQPEQKVLINGASGGVGTFAVQIAKSFGADVTAVCSARNLDMVRSIGADHVIDYARQDFSRDGQHYDLIIAVNGYRSILDYRRALGPRGTYVAIGGSISQIFQGMLVGPLLSRIGSKKMGFMGIAKSKKEDLVFLTELVEDGKVVPVVDRCYPLGAAAEAMRYLTEVHARGKVVLTIDHSRRS